MIAAAPVLLSLWTNSSRPSVPGSTVSTSSPSASGMASAADAALTEVMPGMISVRNRSLIRLCMCM